METIKRREYFWLRKRDISAQSALRMARAYAELYWNLNADWGTETEWESPASVFGEACTDKHCHSRNVPCTKCHYNPEAEHVCVIWKTADGEVLASLGMVDGDRDYHHMVALELAEEALDQASQYMVAC